MHDLYLELPNWIVHQNERCSERCDQERSNADAALARQSARVAQTNKALVLVFIAKQGPKDVEEWHRLTVAKW
jgi:hypothetical protein